MLLPCHPPPPPPRMLQHGAALCRGTSVLAFSVGVEMHLGGGCGIPSLLGTDYFLGLCYVCRRMQSDWESTNDVHLTDGLFHVTQR